GTVRTPAGAIASSTPLKTATGALATTDEPLRSAMVVGSSDAVPSSVSRFSTSNGPSVTSMTPRAGVAAMGGLPRMRQLGRTVTCVPGSVPTIVTYERSTIEMVGPRTRGTGFAGGQ